MLVGWFDTATPCEHYQDVVVEPICYDDGKHDQHAVLMLKLKLTGKIKLSLLFSFNFPKLCPSRVLKLLILISTLNCTWYTRVMRLKLIMKSKMINSMRFN